MNGSLTFITLLVLLAEGILIFRPVVNTTRRVVRLLAASEDAVREANKKLKIANIQLIRAQDDLIRSEEEKYQLQLAEDRIQDSGINRRAGRGKKTFCPGVARRNRANVDRTETARRKT